MRMGERRRTAIGNASRSAGLAQKMQRTEARLKLDGGEDAGFTARRQVSLRIAGSERKSHGEVAIDAGTEQVSAGEQVVACIKMIRVGEVEGEAGDQPFAMMIEELEKGGELGAAVMRAIDF